MKRILILSVVLGCCAPLLAAEKKETVPTSRPTTHVAVVRPTTPSSTPRLTTQVAVPRLTTQVKVMHPLTPGSATEQAVASGFSVDNAEKPTSAKAPEAAAPSASKSAAPSYSPSYKNAKKLGDAKPASALPPSAVKSGLGISGAGNAERAAVAAESSKPEVDPATMESMMKKANIPSDIAAKLKQRNFESARTGKSK